MGPYAGLTFPHQSQLLIRDKSTKPNNVDMLRKSGLHSLRSLEQVDIHLAREMTNSLTEKGRETKYEYGSHKTSKNRQRQEQQHCQIEDDEVYQSSALSNNDPNSSTSDLRQVNLQSRT